MQLTSLLDLPRRLLATVLLAACSPAPGGSTGTDTGTATTTQTTTTTGTASESSTSPTTGGTSTTTTATGSTGTTGPSTTGTSAETTTGVMTAGPTATTDETSTSTGGTTGAPAGPCQSDADCKLVSDCCTCDAVPVDTEVEVCDERCKTAKCDEFGVDQAICRFGTCITERLSCDGSMVLCDGPTPQCDDGFLPETTPDCWTGQCVPIALCDVVPDCSLCPDGTVCVQNIGEGPLGWPWCEPVAPDCGGQPSCDCMGDLVCADPFSFCTMPGEAIHCECINC